MGTPGTVPAAPAPAKVVAALSDGVVVQFLAPAAANGSQVVEHEVRVAVADSDSDDEEPQVGTQGPRVGGGAGARSWCSPHVCGEGSCVCGRGWGS